MNNSYIIFTNAERRYVFVMEKTKSVARTNDRNNYYKIINKTCYTANIVYLIVRVIYLVLFLVSQLYILAIVDAATIVLYLLSFLLLKKKKYYLYALCCGNEFFAFVSVTTIMLGFSTGFHLYLIGLCVVSFFTSYFSKFRSTRGSILWAGLSLTIYLVLYFVTQFNAPYYAIDQWLDITLFTMHAIGVFAFVVCYLLVFLKYTFSLERKIMNESRTDELTQISNRYGLYDYFEEEKDKSTSMLALFDIDDFKVINDTYGHVTGDYILKRVAEITTEVLNDSFVCRYGGEEFVVVLKPNPKQSFFERLESLRTRIEKEEFEFEGTHIHITITIGGATYSHDLTLEKWVEFADVKMYAGKNSGKNKTVISNTSL